MKIINKFANVTIDEATSYEKIDELVDLILAISDLAGIQVTIEVGQEEIEVEDE